MSVDPARPDNERTAKIRHLWEERQALARLAEVRAKAAPRPMPAMDRALRKALAPILKEAGPAAFTLEARWPEIVGARLAAVTQPLRVANGKKGATLYIQAPSAAAPMVQHAADHIMEKVGLATGAKITTLRITQTAAKKKTAAAAPVSLRPLTSEERMTLDRDLAPIQTPAVRTALEKLGEAVLTWNRR